MDLTPGQDFDRLDLSPLLAQILQPLGTASQAGAQSPGVAERHDEVHNEGHDGGHVEGHYDGHDEPGEGKTKGDTGDDDGVAESVVNIVDGMRLGDSEAAALRLAIATGDDNIRGALELFR